MNIMELGAIGELVGGVAVIATLAFLTIEIRRNTTATRRATQQSQVEQITDTNLSIATEPQLAALIAKANEGVESLEPSEQLQLQMVYVNYFNLWDAAYWNRKEGILDDHGFAVWDKGLTGMVQAQAAARKAWEAFGFMYHEEFRHHIDDLIKDLAPVSGAVVVIEPMRAGDR